MLNTLSLICRTLFLYIKIETKETEKLTIIIISTGVTLAITEKKREKVRADAANRKSVWIRCIISGLIFVQKYKTIGYFCNLKI